MEKIDLKKQYRSLYDTAKRALEPRFLDIPPLQYVMIDGTGDPNNSESFQSGTGALYSASYGVKFASKEEGRDFTVMALEGLWWSDDPAVFRLGRREEWRWTLMMLQPDWITREMVDTALKIAVEKGKVEEAVASQVRLERLEEGRAVQILHLGPYAEEGPTIKRMHEFVTSQGMKLRGRHHEIYMSDPRRVSPEKIKTILRHPVEAA